MLDFAKCFCFPKTFSLIFAVLAFVLAYVLYQVFFRLGLHFVRKNEMGRKLIQQTRLPILWLLLEIAAVISVNLLAIPKEVEKIALHLLNIAIIASIGWLVICIAKCFYQNFIDKVGIIAKADVSRRSVLTQVLFLYRFFILVIFAVSIAAILMTFPYVKNVGVGILGSAGIAGLALGIAARPILLNLMAGFQIAATKMIKIGDAILVEGDFARIESIHLTHVIACTWDLRRLILPISYFIDKPFQNWDAANPELLATLFLYCDYTAPVDAIRKKAGELLASYPNWNKRVWNVQVTNCTEYTMEIRVLASADDAGAAFDLRAYLREKLIAFLQTEYPNALPCVRNRQVSTN